MSSTFGKLNLKEQKQILVLNAPESFEPELKAPRGGGISPDVQRDVKSVGQIEFSLAFVTKQKDVDTLGKAIAKRLRVSPAGFHQDADPR